MESIKLTPLAEQYCQIKAEYWDCLLLMRVGSFFESLGTDAEIISKVLGTVLSQRRYLKNNVSLTGFPGRDIEDYLPKLVRAGYKVAIIDNI